MNAPVTLPRPKRFAWSFSKLKNFETCPKRHFEIDIAKNYQEEETEALAWGGQVHHAMAAALTTVPFKLPDEMRVFQKWVDRVRAGPGQLLVEQKYAITREFEKTAWFAPDAWYRGIGDAVRIDGPVALILDWKTGKLLVDSVQLFLMAQCIFSHYPAVQRVRSEYVWLKDDCTTPEVYNRSDMADEWSGVLSRVAALEDAIARMDFPPKPARLCAKWCVVKGCPYWGKKHG